MSPFLYFGVPGDVSAIWFDFFFWGCILVGILSLPLGYIVKHVSKNNVLGAKFLFLGGLLSYGLFSVIFFGNTSGVTTIWPVFYLFSGAGPALLSIILGVRLHYIEKGENGIAKSILGGGTLLIGLFIIIIVLAFLGLGSINWR